MQPIPYHIRTSHCYYSISVQKQTQEKEKQRLIAGKSRGMRVYVSVKVIGCGSTRPLNVV